MRNEYSGYASSITAAELRVVAHLSRSWNALERTLDNDQELAV
jgi:hypothetical protein